MGADHQINNLVLYDGVCKFCNASVNFILKHEKESTLKFSPLQSPLGSKILKGAGLPIDYTKSILYVDGCEVLKSSSAAFQIATFLKRPYNLIAIFRFMPTFLTDFFYHLIADNRYGIWGREDACILPTPEFKARFLD